MKKLFIKNLLKVIPVLLLLTANTSAASIFTATSSDQGWVKSDGRHLPTNGNTFTGSADNYNSFWSFDLTGLSATTIQSVDINFVQDGNISGRVDILSFFDVADIFNPSGGVPSHIDLETGDKYADYAFSTNHGTGGSMPSFTVSLAGDVFTDILQDTNGIFTIGVRVTSGTGTLWSSSDLNQNDTLTITYDSVSVPEPTSLALLGLGLASFCFSRKKKRI